MSSKWIKDTAVSGMAYLGRFFLQFCKEGRVFIKADKIFVSLVGLCNFAVQYFSGGISLHSLKAASRSVGLAILWAACLVFCWLAIKTSRVLLKEDAKKLREYEPLIKYEGDASVHRPSSAWGARMVPGALCAIFIITIIASMRWLPKPPHRYFPWLLLQGNVNSPSIQFVVRDERPLVLGSSLPNNPLENIKLSVNTLIPRSDADGFALCELVKSPVIHLWSNQDPLPMVFGRMDLKGQTALLQAVGSAPTGSWTMIIVVRIINGRLETREVLSGTFFQDDYQITVDEASRAFPSNEARIPLTWDRSLFDRYNIKPVPLSEVSRACQAMQLH